MRLHQEEGWQNSPTAPKTSRHTPRFLPYGTPGSGDLMDFPPVIRLLHGTVHFRETVVRMDLTSCQEPFKSLRFLQLTPGQEVRASAGERFGSWKLFLLKYRGLGKRDWEWPFRTASREMGTSGLQPQEPSSASDKMQLGGGVFT